VTDLSGVLVLWDIDGTLVTHAPLPSDAEIEQAFAVIDDVTAQDMLTAPSTAIAGTHETLVELAGTGADHSVLTGNSPRRARLKLEAAGLAEHIDFDSGFYGHIHSTRMELVADAAQRLSLQDGVRPVIVGDTPLDILAGHASGIPVIAVATGIYSVDELREHRPSVVVPGFESREVGFVDYLREALIS
jgi:phosphoglycolate phosphatase-like HAD superfamily hydrolase